MECLQFGISLVYILQCEILMSDGVDETQDIENPTPQVRKDVSQRADPLELLAHNLWGDKLAVVNDLNFPLRRDG